MDQNDLDIVGYLMTVYRVNQLCIPEWYRRMRTFSGFKRV